MPETMTLMSRAGVTCCFQSLFSFPLSSPSPSPLLDCRCKITSVGETFLASLTNLVELDLSHNLLHTIPSESLKSSLVLRRLILSWNRFPVIPDHAFSSLESLQLLDLSHCHVESVEDAAFVGLKSLKSLHLNGNQLTLVTGAAVEPLSELQELYLHSNNWSCDCGLRDLRLFMLNQKIPLSYSPSCSSPPRLAARQWSDLSLDDFACPPVRSTRIGDHVSVSEGQSVSFLSAPRQRFA